MTTDKIDKFNEFAGALIRRLSVSLADMGNYKWTLEQNPRNGQYQWHKVYFTGIMLPFPIILDCRNRTMPDNLGARYRKLVNQIGLKHVQGGLTLLKIMVVVAIIGILGEVALSAYQNYIARAQVTEAFTFITEIKIPIAKFYADNGTWPTTQKFNSLIPTQTGNYIATIIPKTLASGFQITATFKDSEISAVLVSSTMVLATTSDLKWVCDDPSVRAIGGKIGTTPSKYRPEVCK